jgi:hypothetical protein
VNSTKKKRKPVAGTTKLKKAASKELLKNSGHLAKSILDNSAQEELKNIQFLCDMADDSTGPDKGALRRRSIALDLAAEPPWQPEPANQDTETAGSIPDGGHEQYS